MNAAYQFLDLVPKGRDEPAEGDPEFWVRRHDEYGSLSQHQGADPDSWWTGCACPVMTVGSKAR